MNRKVLIKTVAVVFCLLTMASCNLNRVKNQFDFDDSVADSLSVIGNWGVPVINSNFVLGDYLGVLDSIEFIDTTGGTYRFVYELEKDTLLRVSDYLDTIEDVSIDGVSTEFSFDMPSGIAGIGIKLRQRMPEVAKFTFSIDQFTIDECGFASGTMTFDSVFANIDEDRLSLDTLQLFLDQFVNASGDTLDVVFDSTVFTNHTTSIPLDGYRLIVPGTVDSLSISAYISVTVYTGTVASTETFSIGFGDFLLQDLEIEYLEGRMATQEVAKSQTMEFNFEAPNLDGSISIMNPNIVVSTLNSTGIDGQLIIDKAEFSHDGNNPWELFQNPSDKIIDLPASTTFVDDVINIDEIKFSTDYNRLDFEGRGILSPDGFSSSPFHVTPETMIGFGLKVDVPLTLKIDNLTYEMNVIDGLTLGEKLEADNIDFIDTVALKFRFVHNLPVSFTPQLYLYDDNGTLLDSLFKSNQFITRSFDGGAVENDVEVYVTKDGIPDVLNTSRIDMKVKIDTENEEAQIDKTNYINIMAGARLSYTLNPKDVIGTLVK